GCARNLRNNLAVEHFPSAVGIVDSHAHDKRMHLCLLLRWFWSAKLNAGRQTRSGRRSVHRRAVTAAACGSAAGGGSVITVAGAGENLPEGYLAISQMCPPGSRKLAVRIPHGRSIGPLSSSTPRPVSSLHIASTSSTSRVNCNRTPASCGA